LSADLSPGRSTRQGGAEKEDRAVAGQEPVAGREAQLSFSRGAELGVTIAGEPLDHLLFELILSDSGWPSR
jgi:hypothetical protein